MDMITMFTQGRHCTWWADKTVENPSIKKPQILRGFPAKGIPFPKEEINPKKCDVCPTPRAIKRGPLPWLRKAAAPSDPRSRDKGKQQVEEYVALTAFPKPQTRNKGKEKVDHHCFLRHDGHFKKAVRQREVSFVKQYQRIGQTSKPVTDAMIDYGGATTSDNDMSMIVVPAVPTCGVDCSKIRQDVYRAVDQLLAKQPEVVHIRPRIRLQDRIEFQNLGPLPSLPSIEASSLASEVDYAVGDRRPSRDGPALILSGEQKTKPSTQTQTAPSSITETALDDSPAAHESEAGTLLAPEPQASSPNVSTLLMQVPAIPSLDSKSHIAPQSRITTLLFPQPRIAPSVAESQASTTKEQISEWKELPRDSMALYKLAIPNESSISSLDPEMIESAWESQRSKHWDRERVYSEKFYQEMVAKTKEQKQFRTTHNQGMRRDLVRRRDEDRVVQQAGKEIGGEKTEEGDGRPLEVRLKLSSILERLTIEAFTDGSQGEVHGRQEREVVGGLQTSPKTAEEFELRDTTDPQGEDQQLPINRSISPSELECMKAAILNHNFYPRLVSSFIEQHAAGAPPATVAKLEEVRWRVMQSWNPKNSVECDEKIRKYQDVLTKFESVLEQPFQEAMDFSWRLENMCKILPSAGSQRSRHDQGHTSGNEEEEEEKEAQAMLS